MALFKVLRGNEEHLPQPDNNKDGYAYFTSDTHNFYINHKHTENGPVEQDLVGVGKNTIEGGEIFNDYENNQGISECSSAKGKNTIAGCRGYWYSSVGSVTINNVVHSTITLTNIHDEKMTESWSSSDICEYQPGDTISLIADNKYYNCATIKSINNNIITLNEDLAKKLDGKQKYTYDNGFDGNIVYVISKPQFGNVDLGIAAMAEGGGFSPDVTGAYGPFTHVEGRNNEAIGHYSHAEGRNNKAINTVAHVEGQNSIAKGMVSHAEGSYTEAIGKYSHAEGSGTTASGNASHAEGNDNEAIGVSSHAEGWMTHATNFASHSEGSNTWAKGEYSHAEGFNNQANKLASHVEGEGNTANGIRSHVEGSGNTASGTSSHIEGEGNVATGNISHVEGKGNIAIGNVSHVEGKYNIEDTENKYVHIVGNGKNDTDRSNAHTLDWEGNAWYAGEVEARDVKAGDNISLIERSNISNGVGLNSLQQKKNIDAWQSSNDQIVSLLDTDKNPVNSSGNSIQVNQSNNILVNAYGLNSNMLNGTSQALGDYSHAEGSYNIAFETNSHAEGLETFAQGLNSHAEGEKTTAAGDGSHAEGYGNSASGIASHAEGYGNWADAKGAHAEGTNTSAFYFASHAEGDSSIANAIQSHAEGYHTEAKGSASHVEGAGTISNQYAQHVQGKYNLQGNYAHIVGNGQSDTNRSNAHTLDWNGKAWYADVITSSVFDKKFKDKSGNPIPRHPAQTSLYFGTLKSVVWSYSDWCENSQSPYITLQRPNRHPISGRLTDLFPPEEYDIIISPTDDMIIQYGEEMADAGLQVLSNGTMYVRDEYMLNNLINKDITINITIYYTGKGVMDI